MKDKEDQQTANFGRFPEIDLPETTDVTVKKWYEKRLSEFIRRSQGDLTVKVEESDSKIIITCQKKGGEK